MDGRNDSKTSGANKIADKAWAEKVAKHRFGTGQMNHHTEVTEKTARLVAGQQR